MNNIWSGVVAILMAIIGVAILSVLVSNKANTANVLNAGSGAFANALSAAMAPVTGGSATINTGSSSGFSTPTLGF